MHTKLPKRRKKPDSAYKRRKLLIAINENFNLFATVSSPPPQDSLIALDSNEVEAVPMDKFSKQVMNAVKRLEKYRLQAALTMIEELIYQAQQKNEDIHPDIRKKAIQLRKKFNDASKTKRIQYGKDIADLIKNEQYEEAIQLCDKNIEEFPYDSYPYGYKIKVLQTLKRYEDVIGVAEERITIFPRDPHAYGQKTSALQRLERYEDAIIAADEQITIFPYNPYAYGQKVRALQRLERHEDAILAVDEQINNFPNNPYAYGHKIESLIMLGRIDKARICAEQRLAKFDKLDAPDRIGRHLKSRIMHILKLRDDNVNSIHMIEDYNWHQDDEEDYGYSVGHPYVPEDFDFVDDDAPQP